MTKTIIHVRINTCYQLIQHSWRNQRIGKYHIKHVTYLCDVIEKYDVIIIKYYFQTSIPFINKVLFMNICKTILRISPHIKNDIFNLYFTYVYLLTYSRGAHARIKRYVHLYLYQNAINQALLLPMNTKWPHILLHSYWLGLGLICSTSVDVIIDTFVDELWLFEKCRNYGDDWDLIAQS